MKIIGKIRCPRCKEKTIFPLKKIIPGRLLPTICPNCHHALVLRSWYFNLWLIVAICMLTVLLINLFFIRTFESVLYFFGAWLLLELCKVLLVPFQEENPD